MSVSEVILFVDLPSLQIVKLGNSALAGRNSFSCSLTMRSREKDEESNEMQTFPNSQTSLLRVLVSGTLVFWFWKVWIDGLN